MKKRLVRIAAVGCAVLITVPAWGAQKACIIDIDGTIADESVRREAAAGEDGKLKGSGEWEAYFDNEKAKGDKVIPTARETVKWLDGEGITIFYVSSRPGSMLETSRAWIAENGFPKGKDVIHKKEKYEKSLIYKKRAVNEIKAKGYDVLFGVGDRDKDIQSYEAAEIVGIKVNANDDDDWNRVRKEIKKILAEKK